MPQMAPLSWLTLFLFFLIIFTLFNISNFYMFNYLPKNLQTSKFYTKYNWKW